MYPELVNDNSLFASLCLCSGSGCGPQCSVQDEEICEGHLHVWPWWVRLSICFISSASLTSGERMRRHFWRWNSQIIWHLLVSVFDFLKRKNVRFRCCWIDNFKTPFLSWFLLNRIISLTRKCLLKMKAIINRIPKALVPLPLRQS